MGGFVILQFVGLRGLHSSVAVVQLGATILMSAVRASLRTQLLSSSRNLLHGLDVKGHGLDWLALYIGGRRVSGDCPGGTLTSEGTPPESFSGTTSPGGDIESGMGTKTTPVSPSLKRSSEPRVCGDEGESGDGCEGTSEATHMRPFWRRWIRGRQEVVKERRVQRRIGFLGMAQETPQASLSHNIRTPAWRSTLISPQDQ